MCGMKWNDGLCGLPSSEVNEYFRLLDAEELLVVEDSTADDTVLLIDCSQSQSKPRGIASCGQIVETLPGAHRAKSAKGVRDIQQGLTPRQGLLTRLPCDIQTSCVRNLPLASLGALSQTCRFWASRISSDSDDTLWKWLFISRWNRTGAKRHKCVDVYSWKYLCRMQVLEDLRRQKEEAEKEREAILAAKAAQEFQSAQAFIAALEDDELLIDE